MLNHVVLAALIPVILAKPIMNPRNVGAIQTAAHGQVAEPTATSQMAARQISGELWDDIAGDILENLTPSSSSKANHAHAPSVTPFMKRDEDLSSPTPSTQSTSSATSSIAAASSSMASLSCDCISECADEHGPPSDEHLTASQMTCIQSCANSCDHDDDKADKAGKDEKKPDLLGTLVPGLGLRDVAARQHGAPWSPRVRPHYEPPKFSASADSEYEDCMHNCTTNNCQSLDMGDHISQCGDTSCEDKCKGFSTEGSASATLPGFPLDKKQFIPPPPSFFREPPSRPKFSSSGEFDFEACKQNCTTHNCQSLDMGGHISQCGDTSCEDECRSMERDFNSKLNLVKKEAKPPVFGGPARVKKPDPVVPGPAVYPVEPAAAAPKAEMHGHAKHGRPHPGPHMGPRADVVPAVPDVPDVPAVPNANGMPDDPTAFASAGAEYDACVSTCKTNNCQSADLGGLITQCGDTSCEDQCRHFKSDAKASVSRPKPEPWHRPLGPLDAATQAAKAQSDRHNVKPVAGAEESKEYEDCMSTCKTHNCQSADVGGLISQCGDTECASTCARFKSDKGAGIVA
ncbi:hypothetical protein GGR53DRAFT_469641 [Hypoxylon sp. FL1150]|nr:hypothetical protein GGR53DRAFT_469641 [Hypoxylon sp. FL1150]